MYLILSYLLLAFTWRHRASQKPLYSTLIASVWWFGFDSGEDTKCCKWKQVVLSSFMLKTLQWFFSSSFFFKQMYVYTVGGFVFQRDPLVVIDYAWAQNWVKSGHRMWSEDYTVTDELNPRRISYSVIDEWHTQMRLWGKACDIYQPIFWWCDICRSIGGQRMFLSLCSVLWLGLEIWDLNACCPWQYCGKGDLSMTCCF